MGDETNDGTGSYGLMLTSIHRQVQGGGGADKFRIKIWHKGAGDGVVYDNLPGGVDDAIPTAELGGGSITIHAEK